MNEASQDSIIGIGGAGISRRTALKLAAVGALGAAVGAGASAGLAHWGRTAPPLFRFFSEAESRLLIAICEQIIPRDDTPGATDAGVKGSGRE